MTLLVCALTLGLAASPQTPPDPIWRPATKEESKLVNPRTPAARSKERAFYKCDFEKLKKILQGSPLRNSAEAKERTYFANFPWPDGTFVKFSINHVPGDRGGLIFDGTAVHNPKIVIKGQVMPTFLEARVSGSDMDRPICIGIATATKHNLYGSYALETLSETFGESGE